jgi:hypothetical protein
LLDELRDRKQSSLAQQRFELIDRVQEGNQKNERQPALQAGSGK